MPSRAWNRRRILITSMGIATIAGCLGGDGDDDEPTDDPADDAQDDSADDNGDDDTGPDPETLAAEHITDGRSALQDAFDEMETRHDDDFSNGPFQSFLDSAEAELDSATEHATSDQQGEIDDLQDVIASLRPWGDAEEGVQRGFEQLEPGLDAYWEGREHFGVDDPNAADFETTAGYFETAREAYDASQSYFETAAIDFETARERLEEIDESILESFEHADYDSHYEHHEFGQYLSANLNFLMGGHATGAGGWEATSYGFLHDVLEEYEEGRSLFEDGRDYFSEAPEMYLFVDFEFLYGIVPDLEEIFSLQICEIEHGEAMANHFIAAMNAALDGDEDAYENELQAGFDISEECH